MLIGFALIAAALLISSHSRTQPATTTQPAVVETPTFMAESPLREHIPVTDSDGDGVPDWQELLNNTEPLELPATTTTFTPPETLTDQFALEFFETYVRNEGFGAFGRDPEELISQASDELVAQVRDTLYSERDIIIVDGDPAAITAHANAVATIIDGARLPAGTPNELTIVENALASNQADDLAALDPIIENYGAIIEGMRTLPVPQDMVKEHLDLLNAVNAVHNDIVMMQKMFSDPLAALLRLQRYQDDVVGLGNAVVNLFERARRLGENFAPTDPVFDVYSFQ